MAKLFEPAGEDGVGCGFDIEELEAHADSGFDDAYHGECLNGLALALERDAGAGLQCQRLAGADEAAAERNIRGDAIGAGAGFEVENFRIGSKGIAYGVTTVA